MSTSLFPAARPVGRISKSVLESLDGLGNPSYLRNDFIGLLLLPQKLRLAHCALVTQFLQAAEQTFPTANHELGVQQLLDPQRTHVIDFFQDLPLRLAFR